MCAIISIFLFSTNTANNPWRPFFWEVRRTRSQMGSGSSFFVLKLFRESFSLHGVRPPFVSKCFRDPSQLLGWAKLLGWPVFSLGTLVALKFIFQPQTVWGTTTWRTAASSSRNRCCNYGTIPSVCSEVWTGQRYMHPIDIQHITWFCNLGSMQTHIGPHCALINFEGPCRLWDSFGFPLIRSSCFPPSSSALRTETVSVSFCYITEGWITLCKIIALKL